MEELTTKQIVQLVDLSWDEYGGETIREIAFDVVLDRHGESFSGVCKQCGAPVAGSSPKA